METGQSGGGRPALSGCRAAPLPRPFPPAGWAGGRRRHHGRVPGSRRPAQWAQGLHLGVGPAGCQPRGARGRGMAPVGGQCPGNPQRRAVPPAKQAAWRCHKGYPEGRSQPALRHLMLLSGLRSRWKQHRGSGGTALTQGNGDPENLSSAVI